ncbi:lytic transglycosylase domain-containing protein [Geochorda subterranea]|uniref:Lytic transglycosylase domain-containing protein n=1 Tax=Geochorda subterranea TaxID=3109564 RepID=A0ABZ1BRM5_9FIRM|nr:lytic transglycosylase domain-containing protein [Limnochorda sp. LNt]WRP15460.1 lytic transglycosylase domain-containing protein [Limnochorda sp. LNt]
MRSPHRLTPGAAAALLAILALTVWTATNVRTVLRWWYPVYYRESIVRWSAAHGLDPWLVAAVVRVESNFRPLATSPRGARGLMQLLPETARWVSGRMGEERFFEDLLYDPETNVRLGTWYLADLLREFDGRLPVALAAYNAGRGTVQRWLEQSTWDGSEKRLEGVPYGETRRFVARVLRSWRMYRWLYAES